MVKNSLCSWSGGKDSCFALMQAMHQNYQPKVLLNVLNEEGKISRSHGIPSAILHAQAQAANLPIHLISSSWADYEKKFIEALAYLTITHQLSYAVFGDIDLQPHRDWEEKVCTAVGVTSLFTTVATGQEKPCNADADQRHRNHYCKLQRGNGRAIFRPTIN